MIEEPRRGTQSTVLRSEFAPLDAIYPWCRNSFEDHPQDSMASYGCVPSQTKALNSY